MAADSRFGPCIGSIVRAHTISRASSLLRIARDGHVYAFADVSFEKLEKTNGIQLELVGINKVSTFFGFCKEHDNHLFRSIDRDSSALDQLACLQLAYRGVCKELYLKVGLVLDDAEIRQIESGKPQDAQRNIREGYEQYNLGMRTAIGELSKYKESLEAAIVGEDSDWRHLVVEAQGAMPINVSCAFQPSYLMDGVRLQDLGDVAIPAESVCFSAVSNESGGAFVISYKATEARASAFVSSISKLEQDQILETLLWLAFEMAENIAVNPGWWESLSNAVRSEMSSASNRGLPFGPESNESFANRTERTEKPCKLVQISHF